jgi:cytochrome b subunit of formate dehydrogenase
MLTFPIWGWFKEQLKTNWLKKQPARFKNLEFEDTKKYNEYYRFILYGLVWGLFMFVIMGLFLPLIEGNEITWTLIIIDIITWTITGIALGFGLKYFLYRKGGKQESK